jgi:taurine transport system substrate-binding protein
MERQRVNKEVSMRYIVRICAFVGASFILIATPVLASGQDEASGDLPEEIVIGFQVIPNGEIIAKHFGWHEETLGVPVRWVQIDSGRDLNTAIASGSVDLGLGGSSTTVAAIAQGVEGEVFWIYDIIGENEALVVREDSDIDEIADLEGLRVAAPFGATTHYHLLAAFNEFGLDPESVEIFDMQPPEMLAAWQRGDIDAGFVWEPTLAQMLEFDGRVLISSGELAARGYLTGDIGLVRREFAEAYPDIVAQYVANLDRAVALYREDPDLAAEAVPAEFGIEEAEAARQMASLVWLDGSEQLSREYFGTTGSVGALADVFVATGRFLYEQGTIQQAPSRELFETVINPRYIEDALR